MVGEILFQKQISVIARNVFRRQADGVTKQSLDDSNYNLMAYPKKINASFKNARK